MECIFCKIVQKEIPSEIVYENDQIVVFKDINPKAPIHLLVVPKKHIESIQTLTEEDKELIGEIFLTAKRVAEDLDFASNGYKLLFNVGRGAGQLIEHLHLHILSGGYLKPLSEI